ncbi:EAL domain-containing protein [Halomonas sp. hl-4]|uniref:EAL domain-containing protein n=1 Tax=unclassified Halomonas TaxID=2609666 RepID=UPI0007F12BE6|nr:EAL domain, c-di-GMP-specific phosphodiesterase class I (or its enzymatically inactive variant) [Halomonas sp. HL-93]SNY98931.1 EAL domain, c-di-GMP-specific phosphodiesterase class I (or its enzymatically inactive variant) [Halomonas sp. hl-4]
METSEQHCARVNGRCNRCDNPVPFAFTMAFQPIVDVTARQVIYYEALVRGPNGESAGSILGQVTDDLLYRFDQECRIKAIELASALDMQARLSINFLPNAVYEPEACIQATLEASQRVGWPTERLNFEITETERVNDRQHMRNIIESYRAMGFTTSLDDFGNGYANLDLLTDLRPDTLKIDREIVMECDSDKRRQAILRSLVALAQTLGTQLVAEGVETREESRCLLTLGIPVQQGYYFARPQLEALPAIDAACFD